MCLEPQTEAVDSKAQQAKHGRLFEKGGMSFLLLSWYIQLLFLRERISVIVAYTVEISSTKPGSRLLHFCWLLLFAFAANWRSLLRSEFRLFDDTLEIVQLALEVADTLLVLFLLPSFWLAGLEWFSQAKYVALCELGSMANWNAIDPKDLLDLVGEVSKW
jgi:hypothetical protein